jgi:hypothetical protein
MSGTDAAAVAAAPSAAECVPVLSRDAIAEILAQVPADEAFLFRCAVVCKLWCHLLTDPVILRRLLPAETDRRPSILGFFGERLLPSSADQTKEKENSTVLPVIAVNQIDQQLYLRRFSSAAAGTGGASRDWSAAPTNFFPHERNWRAPTLTNSFRHDRNTDCFRQRQRHLSLGCRAATVCYGTAHWLFECGGIL